MARKTAPKVVKKSDQVVTTTELSAIIGITDRQIQRLAKEGFLKSKAVGRWVLGATVQAYVRFLKDENSRSTKAAAASRASDARTRLIETQIAQRQGELIPADDVQAAFDLITGAYLESVTGLPARITREKRERERLETIANEERARLEKAFAKIGRDILPPSTAS